MMSGFGGAAFVAAGLELERAESDRQFPEIAEILNRDMADVEAVGTRQTPQTS